MAKRFAKHDACLKKYIYDTTLTWKSDIWQLQPFGEQPENKKGASEHMKNSC